MSENLRQNGEMLPVFRKNFTSVLEYFSTIGLYSIAGYPNFAQWALSVPHLKHRPWNKLLSVR